MTHRDRGNYTKKHSDKQIDPEAKQLLEASAGQGKITCASVHGAAKTLGITPAEAGAQADLLELRLIRCSLGLFGHDTGANTLPPMETVPETLAQLLDQTSDDGRISCRDCWNIAKTLKLKRMEVASACEARGLRIKPCQLGAF
ncbi:MAG: hypothetical protein GY737_18445 [Desulfobacteraceae bacterium]|nr:hypothetical protein [Desulfobacteraceae bacterium]